MNDITDAIDLEEKLKHLQGDELSKLIARQLYEHVQQQQKTDAAVVEVNTKQCARLEALENRDKKFAGAVGGASGVIGAVLIAVVNRIFPA